MEKLQSSSWKLKAQLKLNGPVYRWVVFKTKGVLYNRILINLPDEVF
jgi:hypothetical protein